MSAADPVLALQGWKAEPLLLRRLAVYIAEGVVELASLVMALYLAQANLKPPGLYVRLLCLPLVVVSLKLFWSVQLAVGYCRVQGADVRTAINRMGSVHSRSFWSCSAATLTCLSCVLMVWHAIMFLLMTGCTYSEDEAFTVKFLLGSSAAFVVVNWGLWRDFVNHYKDVHDEPKDVRVLYAIFKLHKSKAIQMFKYQDLVAAAAAQDDTEGGGAVAPPAPACVVCLEEFSAVDSVAQLPCGHTFHPTCAHKWILEDWRCPFRCPLDAPKQENTKHLAVAMGPPPALSAPSAQAEQLDVEAGVSNRTWVD